MIFLDLLNEIGNKEVKTFDDVKELENSFLEEVNFLETLGGFEKAAVDLQLLSKVSYYKTMINLSKTNLMALNLLIPELKKDFVQLNELKKKTQKSVGQIEKLKGMKDFFIEGNEIIFKTLSPKFGYFISITKNGALRTINLTSMKNGYHLYGNGSFCSGNTFSTLKSLLVEKQDIVLYITFLKKILTDYDDKHHHLAKPEDFQAWVNFYKSEKKEGLDKIKNIFDKKSKDLLLIGKELNVSEKGLKFIIEKIEEVKKEILS